MAYIYDKAETTFSEAPSNKPWCWVKDCFEDVLNRLESIRQPEFFQGYVERSQVPERWLNMVGRTSYRKLLSHCVNLGLHDGGKGRFTFYLPSSVIWDKAARRHKPNPNPDKGWFRFTMRRCFAGLMGGSVHLAIQDKEDIKMARLFNFAGAAKVWRELYPIFLESRNARKSVSRALSKVESVEADEEVPPELLKKLEEAKEAQNRLDNRFGEALRVAAENNVCLDTAVPWLAAKTGIYLLTPLRNSQCIEWHIIDEIAPRWLGEIQIRIDYNRKAKEERRLAWLGSQATT